MEESVKRETDPTGEDEVAKRDKENGKTAEAKDGNLGQEEKEQNEGKGKNEQKEGEEEKEKKEEIGKKEEKEKNEEKGKKEEEEKEEEKEEFKNDNKTEQKTTKEKEEDKKEEKTGDKEEGKTGGGGGIKTAGNEEGGKGGKGGETEKGGGGNTSGGASPDIAAGVSARVAGGRGGGGGGWRNEGGGGGMGRAGGGEMMGGGGRGRDAGENGYANKYHNKHPLQHAWCVWILQTNTSYGKRDNWCEQQTLVSEFKTVEDFWRVYNNIHSPSYIGNSDYSLFKKGIQPAWEDKRLRNGGRWVVRFPPRYKQLDEMWLVFVLTMIGENFDEDVYSNSNNENNNKTDETGRGSLGELICGGVVKSRKNFVKIELWISDTEETKTMKIGRVFQDTLGQFAEQNKAMELNFECFNNEHKRYFLPQPA